MSGPESRRTDERGPTRHALVCRYVKNTQTTYDTPACCRCRWLAARQSAGPDAGTKPSAHTQAGCVDVSLRPENAEQHTFVQEWSAESPYCGAMVMRNGGGDTCGLLRGQHATPESADTPHPDPLDTEFAYTTWANSCRNLHTIDQRCRRPKGHDGQHAAGFGPGRKQWTT